MRVCNAEKYFTPDAAGLGYFFYQLKYEEVWTQTYLQWLPLVALAVFILGFAIGYAPVPWVMMGG